MRRQFGCCKIRTGTGQCHALDACRKQTHQSSEVVPDLRDVGVQANGARVSIECIPILVNLVVENTNRAPEGRVPAITIDGLLVSFVRLGVLLLRHVTTTQQVPALSVTLICSSVLVKYAGTNCFENAILPDATDFSRYSIARS